MGLAIFALSTVLVYIALATLLHLQFGLTGIVNFGVVGFLGLGMYGTAALIIQYNFPYLIALIAATIITGIIAYVLGLVILDLSPQDILVATLAFASVVFFLATTEKWLTNGVIGLGTVPYPIDLGRNSNIGLLAILAVLTGGLVYYAIRVKHSAYGRLLISIQDNERLARSLGKQTFRQKLVIFTVTCAAMAFFGGLYASVRQFLEPTVIGASVTFTVWIALVIGGKRRAFGAVIGVVATVALFDFLIQTYLTLPPEYSALVPIAKLMLYGAALMLVLVFKPLGILGTTRATNPRESEMLAKQAKAEPAAQGEG